MSHDRKMTLTNGLSECGSFTFLQESISTNITCFQAREHWWTGLSFIRDAQRAKTKHSICINNWVISLILLPPVWLEWGWDLWYILCRCIWVVGGGGERVLKLKRKGLNRLLTLFMTMFLVHLWMFRPCWSTLKEAVNCKIRRRSWQRLRCYKFLRRCFSL